LRIRSKEIRNTLDGNPITRHRDLQFVMVRLSVMAWAWNGAGIIPGNDGGAHILQTLADEN
jgi:hypothetical protein